MQKITIFFILCFLSLIFFGQTNSDTAKCSLKTSIQSEKQVNFNLPDTVKFKEIVEKNESQFNLEKSMPWLVALIIGILSVMVNFWVAHRLRQSNETNLQKQIDNVKDTTLTQFKATIGTKNRQDWINELRNTLSEYLTYSTKLTPDSSNTEEERKKCVEKVYQTKFKIELMINPEKEEQKELMGKVENILKVIVKKKEDYKLEDIQNARMECVKAARKLFDLHWRKIKNINFTSDVCRIS